ncbi:hypothetical protein CAPTEDRAFT_168085 [Capitella teleta]|uniref:Carboxylic ester hydrolase n=1 Tax=Capitella teleta TaxID=283909 RepID=R7VEI7_CAPTE|nr:hypothetical protein CAPTEDRAFT_168085 [Capitella teleta]|eukprot:ELU17243.1 hypothetical protein CAPTEDRAFT_168085 [Capitella teleta]
MIGRHESAEGSFQPISAFLGIPYAQPPVGPLRFARPILLDSEWNGVLDASEYGPFCPQNPKVMNDGAYEPTCLPEKSSLSEDCLQLNIFTPDPSKKLPVLVFIHGGGYIYGSGILYDGTALAAMQDIVVVSFNYRLAPFGYLHDDQGSELPATGHLGHLDQRIALQWVQKYIQYFGGDPSRVTLAGQSAGAASVTFHLLSEESRGLFSQAVIHSDYTLKSSHPKSGKSAIQRLMHQLEGCEQKEIFECLREKSPEEIIEVFEVDFAGNDRNIARWTPVFDGVNLALDPTQELLMLNFTQVPVLIGVTANEGWGLSTYLLPEAMQDNTTLTYSGHFLSATRKFLSDVYGADEPYFEEILSAVLDFNFGKSPKMLEDEGFLLRRWSDLVGDLYLRSPTTRLAQLLTASSQLTFFYEFSHRPSHIRSERPLWHHGCDHTSELQFFWGFPYLNSHSRCNTLYTAEEMSFTKDVMAYYANFIKSGNPNSEDLFLWPEFSRSREDYIIMQPSFMKASGYKQDRVNFYMGKLLHMRNKCKGHETHDEL